MRFGERTAAMLSRTPDLEARLDAVLGKMALVDEGNQSAARLGELAAELDAQVTRVGARLQFVEKLEQRVNGLHVVTAEVEHKLAEQLARRAEVESLKSLCDTLAHAGGRCAAEARRRGRAAGACCCRSPRRWRRCCRRWSKSQQLVETLKKDEAVVHEQRARLAELVEQGKALAAETAERLKQVRRP